MKSTHQLLIAALSLSAVAAFAQTGGMADMPRMDKGMAGCMAMGGMKDNGMQGMQGMQGMDGQKCADMMKGMDQMHSAKTATAMSSHRADAVVKEVDADQGKVTLSHGPVKSLGWPAMTMDFKVKDKALFDKLGVGKKVHVEFKQENADYVVTSVK
jgi:Cu/Ag efflux protein CusF